jgi:16S rRNA (cytosine1402-N4)-methyltransferase
MSDLSSALQPVLERPVTSSPSFAHEPVLAHQVTELVSSVPAGWLVDATLGGAGHSVAVLDSRADLSVLGIDRDPVALAAAQARLAPYGSRAVAVRARFDQLATVVAEAGTTVQPIVGVLFDLGVSSHQFDEASRGFSYRNDGPIDMRMDQSSGTSAGDVVNTATEADLASILRRGADERFAGRIARAIVAARPLTSTVVLAEVVANAIPAPARRRGGHPAKRTFQALRIHVNAELDVITPALDAALDVLAPGGRLIVITYHSGEQRLVKNRLRLADDGGCTCPPGLPCACGAVRTARLIKRGGWTPSAAELATNPRARSARLLAVEKLPPTVSEDRP